MLFDSTVWFFLDFAFVHIHLHIVVESSVVCHGERCGGINDGRAEEEEGLFETVCCASVGK